MKCNALRLETLAGVVVFTWQGTVAHLKAQHAMGQVTKTVRRSTLPSSCHWHDMCRCPEGVARTG